MDIIKRVEDVTKKFDEQQKVLAAMQEESEKIFAQYRQRANEINDELRRLQGEHRLLVELGQEQGVLDEEGRPIEAKESSKEKGKKK